MENWDCWHDLTVNREDLPPLNKRVVVKVSDNTPRWECPDNRAYLEKISVWKKDGNGTEEKRAFRSYYQGGSGLVRVLAWKYEYDPDIDIFKKSNWGIKVTKASDDVVKFMLDNVQLVTAFQAGLAIVGESKNILPEEKDGVYSLSGEYWEIQIKELEELKK